jgi:glycosyltransferase involved in cell wall biosynthesis
MSEVQSVGSESKHEDIDGLGVVATSDGHVDAGSPLAPAQAAPSLSVVIITKNEAHNIGACIASICSLAQEVIVVDSGSRDDTVAIARAAGATVIETEDWPGFGPQKNRALSHARGDWVLSLDADERVTEQGLAELSAVLAAPRHTAYALPRLSQFCGRWVRHSGWYPDYVTRLFRRGSARFSDDLVHERIDVQGEVESLREPLHHYSYLDQRQVEEKIDRYAQAGAEQLFQRGKHYGPLKPYLAGGWAWLRTWVLRAGCLDGAAGSGIAAMNARSTAQKYLRLQSMHRKRMPPCGCG